MREAENLRLYQVEPSFHSDKRHASIILASNIIQSTHLLPKFPVNSTVNAMGWTSEEIYNQADIFYVNPYLRLYDFVRFEDNLKLSDL